MLASQAKDNDALKRQINQQTSLLAEATRKQKQFETELSRLKAANEQLSGNLAQKEAEITELDEKIGEFTVTLRTLRRTSGEITNGLTLKEPVICPTPARCSKRGAISRICAIL